MCQYGKAASAMGYGLITITKELDGEQWSNTYGCVIDDDFSQPLTTLNLDAIFASTPLTDAVTKPSDPAYLGATHPLAALVGFERLMMYETATFVNLFISDGQKNVGAGVFQSVPLSFSALRPLDGSPSEVVAPGNVTWMVTRQPIAVSTRTGRLFYRAAIGDFAVKFGGRGGIDWVSSTIEGDYATHLSNSVTTSGIDDYLAGGASQSSFVLCIPQYYPDSDPNAGDMSGANSMGSFVSARPVSRQVKRGRRRTAP